MKRSTPPLRIGGSACAFELGREGGGRQIAQARMRSHLVIVAPPVLDHDLRFRPRAKPFHAQALVAEFVVEAFGRAILPGLAWLDQRRLDGLCPIQILPRSWRSHARSSSSEIAA